MSCIFHLSGDELDVTKLIGFSPVEPCAVFRKGEARSPRPNARISRISGINIEVSSADFEKFEQQQEDAIAFLSANIAPLQEMRNLPGIERASLDFGIAMRSVVVQSDEFVIELIQLLSTLRCGLMLSQYPVGKKSKNLGRYRKALRSAN